MVCGSRSKASAVADAVQPWASSSMAYHLFRSLGVGARIIRRRKSLAFICRYSRYPSMSLPPITNPSLTTLKAIPVTPPIYPMSLRLSPWLRFGNSALPPQAAARVPRVQFSGGKPDNHGNYGRRDCQSRDHPSEEKVPDPVIRREGRLVILVDIVVTVHGDQASEQ